MTQVVPVITGGALARWVAERVSETAFAEVEDLSDIAAARHLAETWLRSGGPGGTWWEPSSAGVRLFVPRPSYVEAVDALVDKGLARAAAEMAALEQTAPWSSTRQVSWAQVVQARRAWRSQRQQELFAS